MAGVTVLAFSIAGCGGSGGVSEGAEVHVYVSERLCAEAEKELRNGGDEDGDVVVKAVCLPGGEAESGRLDLAAIGADSRRATEDSAAVAFVVPPGRERTFAEPILEEAEISLVADRSGAKATAEVLRRLEARGSGESPREAVWSG